MPTYYCSPRAHWFEGMTEEDRMRLTACAPQPAYAAFPVVIGGGTAGRPEAPRLSNADVERIARRVVELLKGSAPPNAEVDGTGTPPSVGRRAEVSVP